MILGHSILDFQVKNLFRIHPQLIKLWRLTASNFLIVLTITVLALVSGTAFFQIQDTINVDHIAFSVIDIRANSLLYQIDEESAIRAFALTRNHESYNTYLHIDKNINISFKTLTRESRHLASQIILDHILELQRIHRVWIRNVVNPIIRIRNSPTRNYVLQKDGIRYISQYRAEDARLSLDIYAHLVHNSEIATRRLKALFISGGAAALYGVIGIAIAARRQARLSARLDRQVDTVQTLQRAFANRTDILPRTMIGSAYLSASGEAQVGGDLFDVRALDDYRGYVLIADVSGKGVEAAVDTALVKYTVNALARRTSDDPGEILSGLNEIFLDTKDNDAAFVVAFFGIFNSQTLEFIYASAGHGPAFLRRGNTIAQLPPTGPIVGLFFEDSWTTQSVQLQSGDFFLLATDGLTEARSVGGALLNDEGAKSWILEASNEDPQNLVDDILVKLRKYTDNNIKDDLALLAIQILPEITKST